MYIILLHIGTKFFMGVIMKNKKILFISIFILMIVLSIGAVSAQDADDAIASTDDDAVLEGPDDATASGTVSGGVDVVTVNPGEKTSGELSYDIPADAKTIKSADVYVNVYSGSAANTYGANANVTITTANGEPTRYNESLWIEQGSTDGTVYTVNNHTTKCFSDYMIHYNITNLLTGLNGTKLKINVDTFKMENKAFDGRIKLIALVLTYDDGDDDKIDYLINDNQIWTDSAKTLRFDTSSFSNDAFKSTLTNIALSSSDGTYKINDNFTDVEKHVPGWYYQFNQWDITDNINKGQNISLYVIPGEGYSGPSYKSALSVITSIPNFNASVTDFKVLKSSNTKDIIYPGFANELEFTVNTTMSGEYTVNLLVNGSVVNSTVFNFVKGENSYTIVDPTIRPVTDKNKYTTPSGSYETENYQLQVLIGNKLVTNASYAPTVLYNGYLGKDTYNNVSLEPFYTTTVTGDFIALINGTYATGTTKYALTNFTVSLSDKDTLVKAFLYVTYAYGGTNDNIDMFNVTLNGNRLTPSYFTRDASNLKSDSGYGVVVYDATNYLINGVNVLDLNKTGSAGVYPTALVYMYNTTGSKTEKEVYIYNGDDLLGTYGGFANPIKADSVISVNSANAINATAYIFANGGKDGRGTVVINGESEAHPWNGDGSSTDLYTKDITGTIRDNNNISVIYSGSEGGSFTVLQQIIVISKNVAEANATLIVSESSNKKDIIYPGFANDLTVTINTTRAGKYVVNLLANNTIVNTTVVDLVEGKNSFTIVDPTIRPVTDKSKYTNSSGVYDIENYKLQVLFADKVVSEASYAPTVLYNGYLGKDTYNNVSLEQFYTATITGDIVVLINGTYATGTTKYALTNFTVTLSDKDTLVKAFLYVTYAYGGTNDNIDMFNVTLNGNRLTPSYFTRDASNLKSDSGYGVVVYDATNYLINGVNVLDLNKTGSAGVYPTALVYMYNTTGSKTEKEVYIYNGDDLLGTYGGFANPIKADSVISVNSANAINATAYIFANGGKDGRGTVVINGESEAHPWNGDGSSTDLYTKDITGTIRDNNNISVIYSGSEGGSFTALQQIIVVTKIIPVATKIEAPSVTTTYNTNKNLVITLKDTNGAVANAKITVTLNGKATVLTTNANGQATLAIPANLVPNTYIVSIAYDGDATHIKSTASTKVIVKKATVKLTAKNKKFKAKKKVKKYTVTLKDNKGKAMKKVKLTLKVKGKTYKATTNAKGKATFKIKKLTKKGKHTAKITYKGDKYFNKLVKKVKITVKK